MDTANLRFFVEVAQRGSFAAVARDHGLDPSSVSRAVAILEGELGVRLFQRTTRKMTLTEAGALYLARVRALVEDLDRARDEVRSSRSDPVGMLRLTASVAFGQTCIVPLLGALRAAFPRLELELHLTDRNLDLVADRIDLAIRLAPSLRPDVTGVKLFETRYRVCASPAHIAREGVPAAPADLARRDCLLFTLPEFRSRWLFRRDGVVAEIPVRGSLVISTALALSSAARDGLGPALLADWLIGDDLERGDLVDLFPQHDVTATTFDTAAWLLYPSRQYLPRKVRAVIDFLRSHLARRVAAHPRHGR
ncbi:transcriptional regulator, LysR family [Rhizobiales bacterium GAS191]|jgi:DNA-binding transcriptional LysR family regulator|nr:transcriptional regulator, LysR family [Rhizobiales bacterium GAS113]SED55465.1 transcriptional regulator, LysR family [Rhizobiales bacterium GAS191]SEE79603.1 transcriptional regulator, LysR family [Rhizobiales bacterium GAS188]